MTAPYMGGGRKDQSVVKENVRKLVAAGAPDDDISEYLAAEGYPEHGHDDRPETSGSFPARVGQTLAAFGHELVTHPIKTIAGMAAAPFKSAGTAAVAPGVGERRPDPRLSKGGNSSGRPIDLSHYDAEHGGVTGRQRAEGAVQVAATAAASQLAAPLGGALVGAAYNPKDPLVGAATGGIVGGATHGAAKAGGAVLDAAGARPSVSPGKIGRVAKDAGVATQNTRALELIAKKLEQAKMSPTDARVKAAELLAIGKPASLMEVGGEPFMRMTRGAQTVPSEGATSIKEAFEGRRRDAPVRVGRDIEEGFGRGREDTFTTREKIAERQKMAAEPFYQKAFKNSGPVPLSARAGEGGPALSELLQRPSVREAMGYESMRAREQGREPMSLPIQDNELVAAMGPEARARFEEGVRAKGAEPTVSVHQLHNLKIALDEAIGYGKSNAKLLNGTSATKGMLRDIEKTKNDLLDIMDQHSQDYRTGRKIWAGEAELQDALDFGHDFFKGSRSTPEVQHEMAQFSVGGQEHARIGIQDAVREMIDKSRDGSNVVAKIFGNEAQRNRLRVAFPDGPSFERFKAQMEAEALMARNEAQAFGNSTTTEKLTDQLDIAHQPPSGGNLLTPKGVGNALLRSRFAAHLQGLSRQRVDALAPYLTAGSGPKSLPLERVLELIEAEQERAPKAKARRAMLGSGLAGQASRSTQ